MDILNIVTPADFGLFAALNIGVLLAAILVFMMQPGFMLLEVGSISRKNALNDAFKNALDFCICAIAFWLIGYDIITGESIVVEGLRLIGLVRPVLDNPVVITASEPLIFLFQLAFASTAVTICSGAVTARVWPGTYLLFVCMFASVIYPVVAFLVWNPAGVLYGVLSDFAGSIVVHSAGAAAGLAGTLLLRPRIGFNGYNPVGLTREQLFKIAARHAPHNLPLAALGVFFLWIGWYGFNAGTLLVNGVVPSPSGNPTEAALRLNQVMTELGDIAVATALAPASAALTMALYRFVRRQDIDLLETLNAALAGLVAVTAGANGYSPGQAILVGAGAALVFRVVRSGLVRASIDDPVGAIAVHGLTGVYGVVAVALTQPDNAPLFAFQQGAFGLIVIAGVFLASLAAFKIAQFVSSLAAVATGRQNIRDVWSENMLRIDPRTEITGIDETLHGQDAYNFRSMN